MVKESIPYDYFTGFAVDSMDMAGRVHTLMKMFGMPERPAGQRYIKMSAEQIGALLASPDFGRVSFKMCLQIWQFLLEENGSPEEAAKQFNAAPELARRLAELL